MTGLVLLAGLFTGAAASATTLDVVITGSFEEMRGGSSTLDLFTISSGPTSEVSIVELRIDLSGSADVVFDPTGAPFTVTSSDDVGFDAGVGFDLNEEYQLLRLAFTDFGAGETFSFGVDVDDTGLGYTTGAEFAGATLTAVVSAGELGSVQGTYAADLADEYLATASIQTQWSHAPEPSTALLLWVGLVVLVSASRKRGL